VNILSNLLSDELSKGFVALLNEEYEIIRNEHSSNGKHNLISLEESRGNSFKINWENEKLSKPNNIGIKKIINYSLEELVDYINWTYFFHEWRLNGKFPAIFDDPVKGKEAAKLFDEAQEMLKLITKEKWLAANGVVGIFHANSVGDDIEVYSSDKKDNILTTFHFLRNQQQQDKNLNLCLTDFIAPKNSGVTDYIGGFAVTAGLGIENKIKEFKNANNDYSAIMLKILADRLAEAFAEVLHLKIRKELWAYDKNEDLSLDELHLGKYRGIRPAPGYPACPDHSEKAELFRILNANENTGISLTETFMMNPAASVCGWYFANPSSNYFSIGKIDKDQIKDYSKRKKLFPKEAEKWLAPVIGY
jgi:5-methyltetrahydrofolate--homocysteine methyltransferase